MRFGRGSYTGVKAAVLDNNSDFREAGVVSGNAGTLTLVRAASAWDEFTGLSGDGTPGKCRRSLCRDLGVGGGNSHVGATCSGRTYLRAHVAGGPCVDWVGGTRYFAFRGIPISMHEEMRASHSCVVHNGGGVGGRF